MEKRKYIKLILLLPASAERTHLLYTLMQSGFEGFTEEDSFAVGFALPEQLTDHWKKILEEAKVPYRIETEEEKNWNLLWEKQFRPVLIDGSVYIRASFHPPAPRGIKEIIINPRMSFGTGHHETTTLMIRLMLRENFTNKRIIDMGTGTGVLAVLACQAGARDIFAIDIDRWAYENAQENIKLNRCHRKIKLYLSDKTALKQIPRADYFLANINRNILLQDMEAYVNRLTPGGKLILSGFYLSDLPLIQNKARTLGMKLVSRILENDWTAAVFV